MESETWQQALELNFRLNAKHRKNLESGFS